MWRLMTVLAALGLAATAAAQSDRSTYSIEAFIDRAMPASGAPGLAYAVLENGTVQIGAHGELLLGSSRAVTRDTPFLLGSISKSFTAMAVMQLAERELVALDAPIATYLDAFRGQAGEAITVRQLLSHTSGYSTLQGNQSHTDRTAERNELATRVRQLAA